VNSSVDFLKMNLTNARGTKVNQKIVVIESDDWGAIRSAHPNSFLAYLKRFPEASNNSYLKYDTLANSDDLNALFEVLSSVKDVNNKSSVITFNTVVANPNFDKIKVSGYNAFVFEPFRNTLNRYYPNEQVFDLWKEGIQAGLIVPQFHGREHVNVPVWLELLKNGNQDLSDAFEFGTWSTPKGSYSPSNIKIQAALDYVDPFPKEYQMSFLSEGTALFEESFGFKSQTWIPNNFIASSEMIDSAKKFGIVGMQGMKYHVEPKGYNGAKKHVYKGRRFGMASNGMINLVRNCVFEPSQSNAGNAEVGRCLNQIQAAFFWKKPAVITAHRLNFIGALKEDNRNKNLKLLQTLLNEIKKRWPDVVFMDSAGLVELYLNSDMR